MTSRTIHYAIEAPPRMRHEHAESVLKWVWFGGMLLGLALLLTAGEGRVFRGGGSKVVGWQFAQLAHGAVIFIPQMGSEVARRSWPLTVVQAWGLALCASAALWLTIGGGVVAYAGAKTSRAGKWAAVGSLMCLAAAALATLSTVWFFQARGVTFREGSILWMLTPLVMGWGLGRVARRARRERVFSDPETRETPMGG